MRLICLVNNHLGWQALEFLRKHEEIVAVIMHAEERCKFEDEIRAAANAARAKLFRADTLRTADGLQQISATRPELGISVMFGHILRREFLSLLPQGCLNLHPAYLPFNRGAHPNVWSIVDGTPAGVTLHYIDEGIDTGDIVSQKKVTVEYTDTGGSLYRKLEAAGIELLRESWPAVRRGNLQRTPQQPGSGTFHKASDLERLDEIDLPKTYKAQDLLNILRARTFAPYRGSFFRHNGRKVYIRLELEEESDGNNS